MTEDDFTIKEIVQEIRTDLKSLIGKVDSKVGRKELFRYFGAIVTFSGLVALYLNV